MFNGANKLYEFGDFRLDAERGILWRGNRVISLPPKAIELLTLLVSRNGQVVSKQEIFDTVWASTFVEDGVLTQNVYTLRNALGRDNAEKQIIETIPRIGYRFAGTVNAPNVPNEEADHTNQHQGTVLKKFARSNRRSLLLPFLLITVAAAIGLIWFELHELYTEDKKNVLSRPAPIEQLKFERLTDSGDILFPTISPDGDLLAYVRNGEDGQDISIKQIATDSVVRVMPPSRSGYGSLTFSPDGQYLFFREDAEVGSIFQVPVFGGTPRKVAENAWSGFSLSPDGKRAAFVRHDTGSGSESLMVANIDGGGETRLCSRYAPLGYASGPAWSPDGTRLAIAAKPGEDAAIELITIDLASGG